MLAAYLSPVRNRIKLANMTPRFLRLCALLIVVVPLLSACASSGEDAPPPAPTFGCPHAGLMQDADRLAVFNDMANPSRETVTVKAQLYGITYACKPVPSRGEINVTMTARFVADRMPLAGSLKGLTLPYFVAVVDENDDILMHRRFTVRMAFGENKKIPASQARAEEQIEVPIPAPDAMAAGKYKIVAGFELIPAQIRYNKGESELTEPVMQKTPAPQGKSSPPKRRKGKQ